MRFAIVRVMHTQVGDPFELGLDEHVIGGDHLGDDLWAYVVREVTDECTGHLVRGTLQHDGDSCPLHEVALETDGPQPG